MTGNKTMDACDGMCEYCEDWNWERGFCNETETEFTRWLDTFLEEKELPLGGSFEYTVNGTWHYLPHEVLIDAIKKATPKEQEQIKKTIVKIDFCNGNVMDYLRFLGEVLVKTYGGILNEQ